MVKTAVKSASVAVLAAPVALLAACSPPGQVPSDAPATTPSIWTGSPAPSTPGGHGSEGGHGAAAGSLLVPINDASGAEVATATFEFSSGYATVTVETTGTGKLAPGFHGLHIHSVGKCEPNSVAPNGGAPGDFNSAGGHFQVPGHSGHPASGDLSSLQVREDGSAKLVTTTDAFTEEDLLAGGKTAIIIHEKADNFANIPPERYNQVNGTPGPDETTMATGDAGKRVACGVITGE
ncbi:superoxide dismutase[Cu-Zn] [Mycolicibacterium confluentis]|uniref:Superoxide dismutase [Cu-Zn] n=1 Tax=Mycolicibacterium confluentis TaxID=28047 RepID=A0A7I7Y1G8_9MYCO|nr:superoxide dismutase family protein [Mycolicibacterium confluentis]MCV7320461.1 superoxide dismutase family protein [Mycolicibacterium confluentis]ORV21822.1 superoxide dismutase [Mycolicibacterium confluentis]BBZ35500.1 superoxide dismutase [Cu-Zn] [Mycolicibacterium confluentis]